MNFGDAIWNNDKRRCRRMHAPFDLIVIPGALMAALINHDSFLCQNGLVSGVMQPLFPEAYCTMA